MPFYFWLTALFLASYDLLGAQEKQSAWIVNADNTLSWSVYQSSGQQSASPYAYLGNMAYNDFRLDLSKKHTDRHVSKITLNALLNQQDQYRSANNGLFVERFNWHEENAANTIKYRLDVGDFYSNYSYMSLQQSLKGAQIEFQPQWLSAGLQQSILLTSGSKQPDWLAFNPQRDNTTGVSWLIETKNGEALSLNYVHNYQQTADSKADQDQSQSLFSIAGTMPLSLPGIHLNLDAELAQFQGDGLLQASSVKTMDSYARGLWTEMLLAFKQYPVEVKLRSSEYGKDFRPTTATAAVDRKATELFASWRAGQGRVWRARWQLFDDGFQSADTLTSQTLGVTLSGKLFSLDQEPLAGSLDWFVQQRSNRSGSINRKTQTFNGRLYRQFNSQLTGTMALFIQDVADQTSASLNQSTLQLDLGTDYFLRFHGAPLMVSPGVSWQQTSGSGKTGDWYPALTVSFQQGKHDVRFSYLGIYQDMANTRRVETNRLNLDYLLRDKNHDFGIRLSSYHRIDTNQQTADAFRLNVFWRWQMQRPQPLSSILQNSLLEKSQENTLNAGDSMRFLGLYPGQSKARAEAWMHEKKIFGALRYGKFYIYEYPLFEQLIQRQRLALLYHQEKLKKIIIIIDFDPQTDTKEIQQAYRYVEQFLVSKLGVPLKTISKGNFSNRLLQDLQAGHFIHWSQWYTNSGVIRFGIPKRLDGQLRMEIQFAPYSPHAQDALWSLEALR